MIQWTTWYNVQYSIIAYNITIQYNKQWVQYQTIDNIIQCTMITIWYNIQWIQYTIQYNTIQYYNNTSGQCHNYNILTTILKIYFIVYNGYNTVQYATIL